MNLAAARRREQQAVAAVQCPGLIEECKRVRRERDTVLPAGLHAGRWHGPDCSLYIDLGPGCEPCLPGPGGRQDGELDQEPNAEPTAGLSDLAECRRDFGVGQGREVVLWPVVLRQSGRYGLARRVVSSIPLRDRPPHDDADSVPQTLGRRGDGVPDRRQNVQDVAGGDLVDGLTGETWRVRRHGPAPLSFTLASRFPVVEPGLDHGFERFGEGRRSVTPESPRVEAGPRGLAVLERLLPRFRQRDVADSAESVVDAPTADGTAPDPLLRASGRDPERQSVAVAVLSGLADRVNEASVQSLSHDPSPFRDGGLYTVVSHVRSEIT